METFSAFSWILFSLQCSDQTFDKKHEVNHVIYAPGIPENAVSIPLDIRSKCLILKVSNVI